MLFDPSKTGKSFLEGFPTFNKDSPANCSKNIVWDSFGLGPKGSGIARYAEMVAGGLANLGVDVTILPGMCDTYAAWVPTKFANSKLGWSLAQGRFFRNWAAEQSRIVVHGLANCNLPWDSDFYSKVATVLTVHDIIPLLAPAKVSSSAYLQLRYSLAKILPKVDKVVCVSQWSADSLCSLFRGLDNKVVVIRNGVSRSDVAAPLPESSAGAIRCLYVSRYEKYKGFEKIGGILAAAKGSIRLTVVTNSDGLTYLRSNYGDLVKDGRLQVFSNLSDDSLTSLFARSDVYVHLSMYEGFCLPVAEAVGHLLPIAYLSGSAIDELVFDKAAVGLRIADSASNWIAGIEWLNTERAATLDEYRRHRDALPSWHDGAARLLTLYNSL